VFQEIREAQALAYSAWAAFSSPGHADERCYMQAYVGTQADKMAQAIPAMNKLLNEYTNSPNALETARQSVRNGLASNRTLREDIFFRYLSLQDYKLQQDYLPAVYNQAATLTTAQLQQFYQQHVANQPYTLLVLGHRDRLDMDALRQIGPVEEISLEKLFGY
jgi:zinc protease